MDSVELKDCFYDSIFTLHRLSPLHFPTSHPLLSEAALQIHAHRFTDSLKRDILRGVHVSFGNGGDVPKGGQFLSSRWCLLHNDDDLFSSSKAQNSGNKSHGHMGVKVDLEYEKVTYKALMIRQQVPPFKNATDEVHLPLLLTQMPSTLREILLEYLATTFDTRAEPMKLSSNLLGQLADHFLNTVHESGREQLQKTIKDIKLTLGFKAPIAPSLRSLDITVKRDDVASFLEEGKKLKEKAKSPALDREANRFSKTVGPFMEALCHYLRTHMAMDMSHDKLFAARITCDCFTLSREGRIKIKRPFLNALDEHDGNFTSIRRAISNLIDQLIGESTNMETRRSSSDGD